jgi:hypothetical protein
VSIGKNATQYIGGLDIKAVILFSYCNVTVMVDESYTGKYCCYYYTAAAVAVVAFVVVADDDLVQISIDTSILGKH